MKGFRMTKKEIKEAFRANKVQLGEGTIEMIEDYIKREVEAMASRAKNGNFKRLTPELFHYVQGNWGIESGPRRLTKC